MQEVYFVRERDDKQVIKLLFEEPHRYNGCWLARGPVFFFFPDELPDGKEKEKILALTWEDEPYKTKIELSITSYQSDYEEILTEYTK